MMPEGKTISDASCFCYVSLGVSRISTFGSIHYTELKGLTVCGVFHALSLLADIRSEWVLYPHLPHLSTISLLKFPLCCPSTVFSNNFNVQLPLNNMSLNRGGPLTQRSFIWINTVQYYKCIFSFLDFLSNTVFPRASYCNTTVFNKYNIPNTCELTLYITGEASSQ